MEVRGKDGWLEEKSGEKEEKKAREVESGRREEKTCKPKANGNKLVMQHKMQTFMTFMKLAEALK